MSIHRKFKQFSILILFIFIASNFAPTIVSQEIYRNNSESLTKYLDNRGILPKTNAYDPNIHISSNDDLISYCGMHASGSGSQADPFLFFNLTIDSKDAIGITIENTDLYLQIYLCTFNYSMADHGLYQGLPGIKLVNCSHVLIRNNTFFDNNQSVVLDGCKNISIIENACNGAAHSVRINSCDSCTVSNNSIGVSGTGIYLYNSTNLIAESNILVANGAGVIVKQCLNITLQNNNLYANTYAGVKIQESHTVKVERNNVEGNYLGFTLTNSNLITITTNNIHDNNQNDLFYCSNCEILNNTFFDVYDFGLELWDCTGITINENNFTRVGKYAIYLHGSNGNSIIYNDFSNSNGIYTYKSSHNTVEHNLGVPSWTMLKIAKGLLIGGIIGVSLGVALISIKGLQLKSKIKLSNNSALLDKRLSLGVAITSILILMIAGVVYLAA